jgi:hypothetical protein
MRSSSNPNQTNFQNEPRSAESFYTSPRSTSSTNNQNLISRIPRINSTSSQNKVQSPTPSQINLEGNNNEISNEQEEDPMYSVWSEDSRLNLNELTINHEPEPTEILLKKKELKMLKKMRIGESNSKCSVCHENYQKNDIIRVLPCEHFFHYKCLKPWFKKSNCCPLCRLNVREKLRQIRRENGEIVTEDEEVQDSRYVFSD